MKDKRQDTENQLSQLRQFCESQGWKVVHEYVDRASGKRSDREQFQKLFEGASQRKFDVVLFWSLDRFSREGVRETLNHLERLNNYGVNYRSFTEQYLDSCGIFKDAVLAIPGGNREAGAGSAIGEDTGRLGSGSEAGTCGRAPADRGQERSCYRASGEGAVNL